MAKTDPVPGTFDILAPEVAAWQLLEAGARQVFPLYGYEELRTPVLERTDVFQRSLGDQTDVVQKEMYTFEDTGGRSLTLRPEGTAGVIRALANAGLGEGEERRVYYLGPMFRRERPQKGRYRQFHQIGVEAVGKAAPSLDVDCIVMLLHYLRRIGLGETKLLLNSRGVREERPTIARKLHEHFLPLAPELCDDCRRRLQTNVWRLLDCKQESCQALVAEAPTITELLCPESRAYFDEVCQGLTDLSLAYTVEPRLVRGLDYYCHTVFEVIGTGLGAQDAIGGGGRYEIDLPGGKRFVPGVGFAMGCERLLLTREALGLTVPATAPVAVYLVGLGDVGRARLLPLAAELREAGIATQLDHEGRGLKAQMKSAGKLGARLAVILGEDELARGVAACRDLRASEQADVPLTELAARLHQILSEETP